MENTNVFLKLLLWRGEVQHTLQENSREYCEEVYRQELGPIGTVLMISACFAVFTIILGLLIIVMTAPVTPR
ncbi:MAG: hypothetical protein COT91_04815 [Candidatus Doudnabacteria bacterium CG10_big_fil_rev_8_21_14_0_10_41_10]|uniref:Uncharacterized protein n=1 Tax=Candidatus Doudnabacteria bacterium CG10_big_fil_rev_8_21_14_0_10_41_10 TaxID=1974551 RepID=A0A2H0VCH1_9BACT|nr:MAG: hypothetical protein COT91_04815 [Candidatus Doudnabacteria bacterium CG10_big_fil_rev_8_21_14_0_10_41_10]